MTFDDVLPTLLRVCETSPEFQSVRCAVVVRDLRGRVRLALHTDSKLDTDALESTVKAALGAWFDGIVTSLATASSARRLVTTVTAAAADWTTAEYIDSASGSATRPKPGRWKLLERHLSKHAWVEASKGHPPWSLGSNAPAIVTFYSFKGGVGRTTLLASVAWQLAASGKRVVAVDLDLEAPGLGALLGVQTQRGVVDYLVDHAATEEADVSEMVGPATALGPEAGLVDVVPAGELGFSYFEKLARLDFAGSGLFQDSAAPSPVRGALRALLYSLIKRNPRPEFILLDARAGLHDLAGISLHDLAHIDVLVGRESDQGYRGLEMTVEALGRRRNAEELRCVVVQSMAPDDPSSSEYASSTADYRSRSYQCFAEHAYPSDDPDNVPAETDQEAAHYPCVVRHQTRLLRFSSLAPRREELFGTDYQAALNRILALAAPEPT